MALSGTRTETGSYEQSSPLSLSIAVPGYGAKCPKPGRHLPARPDCFPGPALDRWLACALGHAAIRIMKAHDLEILPTPALRPMESGRPGLFKFGGVKARTASCQQQCRRQHREQDRKINASRAPPFSLAARDRARRGVGEAISKSPRPMRR